MSKSNILITGANGFIGSACVNRLANEAHLTALDLNSPQDNQGIPFIKQDITKPFQLDQTFDYVIHLAALNVTHVGKASLEDYRRVHVEGTENLIRAVRFKKFVYFSSAKVYKNEGEDITEDSAIDPQEDYECSKLEAEEVCRRLIDHNQLVIVRPVNIVGETQPPKALLPVLYNQAVNNDDINIFAPHNSILQLLHVSDVVSFLQLIVQSDQSSIFNLASDDTLGIKDFVNELIAVTGSSSKVEYTNSKDTTFSKVLAQRAYSELKWKANTSIKDIIQKYHVYHESNT